MVTGNVIPRLNKFECGQAALNFSCPLFTCTQIDRPLARERERLRRSRDRE